MSANRLQAARKTLEAVGQGQVLHYVEQLSEAQRAALLEQIEGIDWPEVAQLIETHVKAKPHATFTAQLDPAPWYPYQPPADLRDHYAQARALGEQLLRQGKVAAFTVAGGQGTRLGWNGPKGSFPSTPIRRLPLFACFAEYLHKIERKYGHAAAWYIMTSPTNDADTRAFFQRHNYFGLNPADVMLFPQAMMPAIDMRTGKALLEDKHSLALSPNGHGGSLKALYASGAIADMKKRGIEQISYIQVDNPLSRVIDPQFLGLHALDGAQMSSKMLPKREPLEKLGNFCLVDGRMTVIEYSDLPDELAHQRLPNGQLRFLAGSIALHMIRVDFVESINRQAGGKFALPFHRAEKKVPFLDLQSGRRIAPDKVNAVKLETFVFDALPMCQTSIIYETDRADEFAPIKNADGPGVQDCPATSQRIQIERAGRWLQAHGVDVPRNGQGQVDAVLEISQLTAIYPEDLEGQKLPSKIERGSEVML